MLSGFLPDAISPLLAGTLVLASMVTSMLTASMGAGGGVILLTLLSLWMPPLAVIPVHGMVQLGSNGGRAAMTWKHIHWPTIGWFLPGVVVGVILGGIVLVRLPVPLWQLIIALFVLYLCWGPPLPKRVVGPKGITVVGALTAFAGLFVGASGPLVAAYLKQLHPQRFTTVATFSLAMVLQHAPKALVFTLAGFAFPEWTPLIIAMIIMGGVGTWFGLKVLGKLSDIRFKQFFNIFLTLMSLRLLWLSAGGFGIL